MQFSRQADCVACTELWVPSKLEAGAQNWLGQWIPVSATEEFDAALLYVELETIQDDTVGSCFKDPKGFQTRGIEQRPSLYV